MSDIAVRVEHLSKMYRLGIINNGALFKDIQTWIALKRGKEDPHSKIGENKYSGDKDHFWALKDISFDITKGDRIGIIGKNGAGKSTLLKLLSRITAPTEGIIKTNGKIASLLEVGTGFHGELTGKENIYLNGAILGMKKRRIDEKLDDIIAFSGIEQHIDTPVKRYSSGMYVRLAFAVAAHLDSDILIADEVLAVGDAEFQKKALGKMQDLSTGEGRTVLFVSHNMQAVKNLCNSGMVVEKGIIKKQSQNINEIVADYLNTTLSDADNDNTLHIWNNNGNIKNPNFTPICLALEEEDGAPISLPISSEKKYRIKLDFEILEYSSSMGFFLMFSDGSGTILFYSTPLCNPAYKPKIGKNRLYCLLPKNLFHTNKYIVSVGADISASHEILRAEEYSASISFFVTEANNSLVINNSWHPSIINPLVTWYDK